jgi:hypothetical protein
MSVYFKDFFDDCIVPFILAHPDWVQAIKHRPPSQQVQQELQDFSAGNVINQLVVILHMAKYANKENGGHAIYSNSLQHLTNAAMVLYYTNTEGYESFREAVLEFFSDSTPENRAYFSLLFPKIESDSAIHRVCSDHYQAPPTP